MSSLDPIADYLDEIGAPGYAERVRRVASEVQALSAALMTAQQEREAMRTTRREECEFLRASFRAQLATAQADMREKCAAALDAMQSVLCDPVGNPCFEGSDGDRQVIREAMDGLRAALPLAGAASKGDFAPCADCITERGCARENRCKWPGHALPLAGAASPERGEK